MKLILLPFMVLAALGLFLSIFAHAASLAGITPPGGQLVWGLHTGIFVVWLPTVLIAARITRDAKQKDLWKVALSGCPPWMRQALYVLTGYVVLNFLLFMFASNNHPHQLGDPSTAEIRGFSGHWMIFYGVAFATIYSATKCPQLLTGRKCSNGHSVSLTDKFCPACGAPLGSGPAGA